MDLRVKKTLKSIKEAFYQLRKKKPIEKISVKELSEIAMINKATFYLHYKDVYDLSEKLENELISEVIDNVRQYDLRLGKSEFRLFAENLSRTIVAHSKEIEILFSGYDNNRFVNHLEDRIKEYVFMTFPNIPNNNEINIIFTLFIQGSYHTHIRNKTINPDILIATTTSLFMKLIDV
ncbi:MAG: TetR/AcrR family transcriptional regulator [Ruminococcus sp.]|nr:TetR/AcrR family transcriptional regulator [Ruminococcus sp.]